MSLNELEVTPDMTRMIELEMTYTPYIQCCKDPTMTPTGDMRLCRRHAGHVWHHASGFGENLYLWKAS